MIKDVCFNQPGSLFSGVATSDVRRSFSAGIPVRKTAGAAERSRSLRFFERLSASGGRHATLRIPEPEQLKAAVVRAVQHEIGDTAYYHSLLRLAMVEVDQ